ncbi:MAG: DNA repair protein RecN [Ruminococcaceae bacterium]|nr:DNA repair protein RecN [Oscillospiraceae bacterium]
MLNLLHIENIAVIESADIVFDKGFNVLTGETGAGKSIVIDAISAIAGERTYREVIRTGTDKASVSATFSNTPHLAWFDENGVDYDSETLIQRDIFADGRNVCRVNGKPVNVALLRTLGRQLINIHGQHDAQQLFDERYHLQFLDLYAENEAELQAYQAAFAQLQVVRSELDHLNMDEGEKQRRVEMLRYQIAELERANLKAGEEDALEERRKLLQNAEKLRDGLVEAYAALYGGEDSDGAVSLISQAERALAILGRYTDSFEELHKQLGELKFAAQDAAEELRDQRDSFEFSDDELEQIESRLDTIHKLRKYGADTVSMLEYLENAKKELDEIEFSADRVEKLQKQLEELEKAAMKKARALRAVRQTAAERLAEQLKEELRQLDMPKVQFMCEFEETAMNATGADAVRFLMSANAGEALRAINKVASGGELARIMLAMKNVLAERDAVPTLIFDEVDTGVSGRAAQKVAEKLYAVSVGKQVLCVTHLPQIAAMADTHFRIEKAEREGRTYTSVVPLDRTGRQNELARLTGGAQVTDTLLASVGEMLDAAAAFRAK